MTSNGQRFRRRSLRRGYKVDEVDEFLDRVEATLNGDRVESPVRSHEVHDVVFRVRFGGYDEWQVDLHLDRVERQLAEQEGGAAPAERATADRMPERISSERVPPHAERRQMPAAPLPTRSPMGSGIAARGPAAPGAGPRGAAVPSGPGGPGSGGPGAGGLGPGGPGGPGSGGPGSGGPGLGRGPGVHGMTGQRPTAPGGYQAYDEPTYAPPSKRPPVPPIAKAPAAPQPPNVSQPPPSGPHAGSPTGSWPTAPGVYGTPQGSSGYDASRHGRMDMTTEMRMPDMRPGAAASPPRGERTSSIPAVAPAAGGPSGGPGGPGGNGVASPGDVQRIDQIRRGFQARRFGSGYDRAEVDRLFEGVIAAMSGRSTMPVNETELDPSQFSLVPGGYFEDEVDQALREVRDIFRRR